MRNSTRSGHGVAVRRLVRLIAFGGWWGWRDLAWSVLVYWPAGAFWGCCLVHYVLRPALEKSQEQLQQEFRQPQEPQAIFETEAASLKASNSTLGWQISDDEGSPRDPLATSQNLYCPSCGSPLGLSLHSQATESIHEPFSGHVLEAGPFLPNVERMHHYQRRRTSIKGLVL